MSTKMRQVKRAVNAVNDVVALPQHHVATGNTSFYWLNFNKNSASNSCASRAFFFLLNKI